MPGHRDDVTVLLRAWGEGDGQALHQLMPVVERMIRDWTSAKAWLPREMTTEARAR